MSTESSTQQRPWAAVAPNRSGYTRPQVRTHFAAMALAHWKAVELTVSEAAWVAAVERSMHPMLAAFTAAALLDGWTVERIQAAEDSDGPDIPDACHEWLTAAGIDPDEIEAAR